MLLLTLVEKNSWERGELIEWSSLHTAKLTPRPKSRLIVEFAKPPRNVDNERLALSFLPIIPLSA